MIFEIEKIAWNAIEAGERFGMGQSMGFDFGVLIVALQRYCNVA